MTSIIRRIIVALTDADRKELRKEAKLLFDLGMVIRNWPTYPPS